jgi:Fe2+ or Zn2+ uptake regulation protein
LRSGAPTAAKVYEEQALLELRAAGYRITMPRVQVIRALGDTPHALSAYAIHEKIIGSGGKIDVVSVYRILATLQEVGLIHHIGVVDGYFPARVANSAGKRSEVLVSEENEQITEFTLPDEIYAALEKQVREAGFDLKAAKVELIGSPVPK